MVEKAPGYVYILTNPSFREDWVKIGKSSLPVDVRSKELDNTAVPLPFEIFATMQTVKYNEVEKLVHKTIDRIATGEVAKYHTNKLAPGVITLAMLVCSCCPNNFSDIFFRHLADYLCEKCYICHKEVVEWGLSTKVAIFTLLLLPFFCFYEIYLGQY